MDDLTDSYHISICFPSGKAPINFQRQQKDHFHFLTSKAKRMLVLCQLFPLQKRPFICRNRL